MPRAVVFDLDDTLYPERSYVESGYRAVAAWVEEELTVPAQEVLGELWGLFDEGPRQRTFDRWLRNHGLESDGRVRKMVRVYRDHQPEILPYPGVPRLLRRLRRWHRLGLITDGRPVVQRRKLAALGLEPYFEAPVFSDDLGRERWKPHPAPFIVALERLWVSAGEAVYVGDNPLKDFIGPRRVGMWTVRVRSPGGLYVHLAPPTPAHAPHFEIRDLRELEAVLASSIMASGPR